MPKVYYEVLFLDVTKRRMYVSADEELSSQEIIDRIQTGYLNNEDELIEAAGDHGEEVDGYLSWDTFTVVQGAADSDVAVHLELDDPGPLCGDAGQIDDCIKPFGHMDECQDALHSCICGCPEGEHVDPATNSVSPGNLCRNSLGTCKGCPGYNG